MQHALYSTIESYINRPSTTKIQILKIFKLLLRFWFWFGLVSVSVRLSVMVYLTQRFGSIAFKLKFSNLIKSLTFKSSKRKKKEKEREKGEKKVRFRQQCKSVDLDESFILI